MRPLRSLLTSFFLVLTLPLYAQAAPPMGTYIGPDSFDPGNWSELLKGGEQGKPGNVISAQSLPNYFLFEKAEIKDSLLPEPITPPSYCEGNVLAFKTVYQKGVLTLYNTINAPWRKLGDPPSYSIDLPLVHVTTCKYLNANGAETGEISFFLKSQGLINLFPGYTVEIEAKYQGNPVFVSTGVDVTMGDQLDWAKIVIKGPVAVDIKPGSCPNPVNVKSQGVLPVAILGGANLNVRHIDPASITLEGVQPLRYALEDVGAPFNPLFLKDDRLDCNTEFSDGFLDLTLKFETQDLVEKQGLTTAEDKSIQVWSLKFKLMDGTELKGSDVVWILNKNSNGKNENKGNRFQRNKNHLN